MTPTVDGKAVAFLGTGDRETARAFYGQTLGLRELVNDDFGMAFAFGTGQLRVTPLPDYVASPHPVAGWDVPDIGAAAQALKAVGVELTRYEGFGQDAQGIWTSPDGAVKVAWFADPDGNVLSLSQTNW